MNSNRAPVIAEGQVYLNADLNEYLIVTRNNGGQISYQGIGFNGNSEDQTFVERFQPVAVEDLEPTEVKELLNFCKSGTQIRTGFISE